jgi:cytoskeletal protein CcmA (bactofilin family)
MEYSDIPNTRIRGSGRINLPNYGSISISGSGDISPEKIKTRGSTKLPGGLVLGKLSTRGSTHIDGGINAEELDFKGSTLVNGDTIFLTLTKSGSMHILGDLDGKEAVIQGSHKIEGNVSVSAFLESKGSIKVNKDVECDGFFSFNGVIDVSGNVRADHLEGRLESNISHVGGDIEAKKVDIRPIYTYQGRYSNGKLNTRNVYADEIYLENVVAEDIKGNNITIGPGCEIKGNIKYKNSLEVNPEAKVSNEPKKFEKG